MIKRLIDILKSVELDNFLIPIFFSLAGLAFLANNVDPNWQFLGIKLFGLFHLLFVLDLIFMGLVIVWKNRLPFQGAPAGPEAKDVRKTGWFAIAFGVIMLFSLSISKDLGWPF